MDSIGQGCNFLSSTKTNDELVDVVRFGIDNGLTLIDTAEAYGRSEAIVGRAIEGVRDKVFVCSKFSPEHSPLNSCERSLRRMGTDYIDLYMIHWPNPCVPIEETVGQMDRLKREGKIIHFGVCNFPPRQLKEIPNIYAVQYEYNLMDRSAHEAFTHTMPFMAYSPLGSGALLKHVSARSAIAWVIQNGMTAIVRSTDKEHITQNIEAKNVVVQNMPDLYHLVHIHPSDIYVDGDVDKGMIGCIALSIRDYGYVKPIRVTRTKNGYRLVGGKVRYHAWVCACGDVPIPALVV